MALQLGAPLGAGSLHGPRALVGAPAGAPANPRARRLVTCQAAFGGPKAASHRVREQSPSKMHALAAPAVDRDLMLPAPPSPPPMHADGSSNILEVRRSELLEVQRYELERLMHQEAVPGIEPGQRQQQQQQQQRRQDDQQRPAAAQAAQLVAPPAPASQQRRAQLVPSTRISRGAVAASASAAAGARAAPDQTSAALTSWLLDCRSRRERRAATPLAAPSRRGAATPRQAGVKRRAAVPVPAPAPAPALPELALPEGLSEETRDDMALLISTRATLRSGRRSRRARGTRSSTSDMMSTYMRSLGNTSVLGRAQEARLAAVLQKGIQLGALGEQLAAAAGGPVDDDALAAAAGLPSAADVAQRRANQREAKDLLMQHNVRLVINIAKRYVGNGIDIVDLIPEGLVGLSKSLDRFDASKGFKFSTYAHWWIRQSISRAVCDQARVVRLPSHVCETLYRINRAIVTMVERSERDELPTYEEIAEAVGLPVRRVIHYLRLAKLPGGAASARDRPTHYLSGSSLKEVAYNMMEDCAEDEDPCEEGEEEAAQHESIRQMTDLLLSTLEKRERNILRLRYGLLGWQPAAGGLAWDEDTDGGSMSLGDVASAYGLSKERIRQIEDKAMRALRKPWRQQLAQEVKFGEPISPSNLSHLASARQLAEQQGAWP